MGFSLINQPFGVPAFQEIPIYSPKEFRKVPCQSCAALRMLQATTCWHAHANEPGPRRRCFVMDDEYMGLYMVTL